MLGLKLIHISKRGHWKQVVLTEKIDLADIRCKYFITLIVVIVVCYGDVANGLASGEVWLSDSWMFYEVTFAYSDDNFHFMQCTSYSIFGAEFDWETWKYIFIFNHFSKLWIMQVALILAFKEEGSIHSTQSIR